MVAEALAMEAKEAMEAMEAKEAMEAMEARQASEAREASEVREARVAREAREAREAMEAREAREAREVREIREAREARDGKENLVKVLFSDAKAERAAAEVRPYRCHICNKSFHQKSGLTKHIKTHNNGDGHVCDKCNKKFAANRDLRKHVNIVHLNKGEEYKKECPICHVRVQQLKTHIRFIHRNEGKTSEYHGICPHCHKSISNDYKVKRHIVAVNEGVKHWQCSVCPKKFYEKKDLSRHIRGVHIGEKVDIWKSGRQSAAMANTSLPSVQQDTSHLNHTALPVNVMEEEEEELPEASLSPGPVEVAGLRFHVMERRVDEDGDLVVEIEEKEEVKVEPAMVTLRWGGSPGKREEVSRLEGLVQQGEELGEDFVLPEVVGDTPDWLLQGVEDILRVQDEAGGRRSREGEAKTAFKCGACGKMFLTLDFLKAHIEKIHVNHKLPEEEAHDEGSSEENKTVFKVHNDEHGKKFVISRDLESMNEQEAPRVVEVDR